MSRFLASFLLVVSFLGGHRIGATAQLLGLPTTCSDSSPTLSWVYNSLGQPPCAVLNELLSTYVHSLPGDVINNPCLCSTGMYSLYYACLLCTDTAESDILDFGDLAADYLCDPTYAGFPVEIPSDTAAPSWAYLNLTTSGRLDVALAKKLPPGTPPPGSFPDGFPKGSTPEPSQQPTQSGEQSSSTSAGSSGRPPQTHSAPPASTVASPTDTPSSSTTASTSGQASLSVPALAATNGGSSMERTSSPMAFPVGDHTPSATPPGESITYTVSGSVTIVITAEVVQTSAPPTTPSPSDASHHDHSTAVLAGAFAAAGAVVLIAGSVVAVLIRRRRKQGGARGHWLSHLGLGLQALGKTRPLVKSEAPQTSQGESDQALPTANMKFYDPEDPSTYPPPLEEISRSRALPAVSNRRDDQGGQ
ncbi:hypothetical protein FKP32DRAFT_940383 [Trametes sanguinea]|nr:hypothetical protein FKP32DRAFT_940383 [Trametes sanguinea]